MKRKIIAWTLVAAGLFSLTACGKKEVPAPENTGRQEMTLQEEERDFTSIAPFETVDIYGKPFSSEDLSKNKLTMVNVFATWCGPCVNEIPELSRLQEDYASKGFGIVGVLMDAETDPDHAEEALDAAKTLYEKAGVTYPFILPDQTFLQGRVQDIQAIPETFFVDSRGNIVGNSYSGARSYDSWKEIVDDELAKLPAEN